MQLVTVTGLQVRFDHEDIIAHYMWVGGAMALIIVCLETNTNIMMGRWIINAMI